MRRLLPYGLLLSLLWQAVTSHGADRSAFGREDWPLWSPLDKFQQFALSQTDAARAGDADALLALYLLASGEALTMKDFYRFRDEMDDWLSTLRWREQPAQNAQILFLEMHTHYLGSQLQASAAPDRYRVEQSQLAALLRTGEFNCISSSLLYIVAARKLGLDVSGVLLSSHAFVQLNLAEGGVDLETTAFNGFGLLHDEAFYSDQSGTWFSSRELAAPTWIDYINRQIVTPFELGVFNMSNQHVEESRLGWRDRLRLAELRGLLSPFNQEAQKTRLAYYYEEFVTLREDDNYRSLSRMYGQIGGYLDRLAEWQFLDPEAQALYLAVQAQRADTLVRDKDPDTGLALARQLLQTRDFSGESAPVEAHLFSTLNVYSRQLAEKQQFEAGRFAYTNLEERCVISSVCDAGLARFYGLWVQHLAHREDWEQSADKAETYLLLNSRGKAAPEFRANLERIYLNWASREEYHGEWETAMGLLNRCGQQLSEAPGCEKALMRLEQQHSAGYL
ncbi:MAG: transglutaminase family protein [Pseudomonadota bacterium]